MHAKFVLSAFVIIASCMAKANDVGPLANQNYQVLKDAFESATQPYPVGTIPIFDPKIGDNFGGFDGCVGFTTNGISAGFSVYNEATEIEVTAPTFGEPQQGPLLPADPGSPGVYKAGPSEIIIRATGLFTPEGPDYISQEMADQYLANQSLSADGKSYISRSGTGYYPALGGSSADVEYRQSAGRLLIKVTTPSIFQTEVPDFLDGTGEKISWHNLFYGYCWKSAGQ